MIGVTALWTCLNAVAQERPEGYDRDHYRLRHARQLLLTANCPACPSCPSDSRSPWSNAQVRLVWNAAANATAYFAKRATMRSGPLYEHYGSHRR